MENPTPPLRVPRNDSGSLAPARPRVILTHGEDGPRRVLRGLIQKRFGLKAELPEYLETIEA